MARMGAGETSDGYPAFVLVDKAGHVRFRAILDDDGDASLQILDADGNVSWSAT